MNPTVFDPRDVDAMEHDGGLQLAIAVREPFGVPVHGERGVDATRERRDGNVRPRFTLLLFFGHDVDHRVATPVVPDLLKTFQGVEQRRAHGAADHPQVVPATHGQREHGDHERIGAVDERAARVLVDGVEDVDNLSARDRRRCAQVDAAVVAPYRENLELDASRRRHERPNCERTSSSKRHRVGNARRRFTSEAQGQRLAARDCGGDREQLAEHLGSLDRRPCSQEVMQERVSADRPDRSERFVCMLHHDRSRNRVRTKRDGIRRQLTTIAPIAGERHRVDLVVAQQLGRNREWARHTAHRGPRV